MILFVKLWSVVLVVTAGSKHPIGRARGKSKSIVLFPHTVLRRSAALYRGSVLA
jgi:hypothetical protein